MEEKNIRVVEEQYIQISESRVKNTIKEYKKGLPYTGVLSSSFACMVSFFIAFASYSKDGSVWKWIFLSLLILSFLVFLIFGTISLIRNKIGRGTEKWFMNELCDSHPTKTPRHPINSKFIFNIINFTLIIGIPVAVLLAVLGCNGWNISNQEWAPVFWVLWIIGTLCSLIFGTFINSWFAYLFFGFEGGIPDIFL